MACVMGIIFYLSHQPGDLIQFPLFSGGDKLAHCIAYGCLAATFLYGLNPTANSSGTKNIAAIIVIALCVLFGISDEYHQSFIPGRQVSFWDLVADGLGALLVVIWWLSKVKSKENLQ